MAIVNAIKKVRKHLEIMIDGERICITKSTFRERPLEEGQEIDIDDYKQFVLLHQYKPALTHAADLLAAKGYAEKELERTLVRGGYLQETAEMVVTKLKTLGLLNDQLYAETYLDSRSGAGYGVNRMKQDLKRKGVDEETIRNALEDIDQEVLKESATSLARRSMTKRRPGESQQKGDQRIINMLIRRGFSYDDARHAVSQVHEELGDTEDEDFDQPSDEEQLEAAAALVRKALARPRDEDARKTSQRILSMLARRGYSFDLAKEALSMVLKETEE